MTLRAISAFTSGGTLRQASSKHIVESFDRGISFTGAPVADWAMAREVLLGCEQLHAIFEKARLLRLLRATDALAWGLLGAWNGHDGYRNATAIVRQVLAEEALTGSSVSDELVHVMNMHKSKGKEFDGVLIAEDRYRGQLLDRTWSPQRVQAQRRVLRVAITRARRKVVLVRPEGATLLVRLSP